MKKFSPTLIVFAGSLLLAGAQYTPDWDSLDSRPLPQWYDDAKIGIFIHWGLYSVPSFGTEWFWQNWQGAQSPKYIKYMEDNYRPGFTYQDFGPMFTAEFFEPDKWAKLFQDAGARYVVLTSKHHEGYTLWPSKYSWGWNALDVGPKRDLVGDLANSIRNQTPEIHFGLYHSLYEWFNPLFLSDKANNFTTDDFVTMKSLPSLYEITTKYKPEVIWSDGEWEAPYQYWRSTEFIAWLFNQSPVKDTVVVNDRWGSGDVICHHGSFYTCADRYNPGVLQDHKWENAMTLDETSWGYNRLTGSTRYLTIKELLTTMVETISCGGNLLVNVGPSHDGRIAPIMEERLRQMGKWLSVNGEAIYESRPWIYQNDSTTGDVWYTERDEFVYATVLSWPKDETLSLGSIKEDVVPNNTFSVSMLGYPDPLEASVSKDGVQVFFPSKSKVGEEWAWVLKFQGIKTFKHQWINRKKNKHTHFMSAADTIVEI